MNSPSLAPFPLVVAVRSSPGVAACFGGKEDVLSGRALSSGGGASFPWRYGSILPFFLPSSWEKCEGLTLPPMVSGEREGMEHRFVEKKEGNGRGGLVLFRGEFSGSRAPPVDGAMPFLERVRKVDIPVKWLGWVESFWGKGAFSDVEWLSGSYHVSVSRDMGGRNGG